METKFVYFKKRKDRKVSHYFDLDLFRTLREQYHEYCDDYDILYYKENSSYFMFPYEQSIIDHDERKERIGDLIINCIQWSISTKEYFKELRNLEIFQIFWNYIKQNPKINETLLLFIDLHIFIHYYASTTFKSINGRKERSVFALITEKLLFNSLTDADELSLEPERENNMLKLNLLEKLRNGITDPSDSELLYDLKLKRNSGETAGVQLNAKEITMLEYQLLNKSFDEETLLNAYLKSGRNTLAKSACELELVISNGNCIRHMRFASIERGEVLIARKLNKMSLSDWMVNKIVRIEDIKLGGKLSSEIILENFSCGTIENYGNGVLYLKPSEEFKIIAHYTNYNGHIELVTRVYQAEAMKYPFIRGFNFLEEDSKAKELLSFIIEINETFLF